MSQPRKGLVSFLQEFSIPLIAGVVAALALANLAPDTYHHLVEMDLGFEVLGYTVTPHWLVNDIFMVFFFGIAAKEIVEAVLPGGSLNPFKKAVNPLIATMGGVLGPIAVFFGVLTLTQGAYGGEHEWNELMRGWGIPTATDIALAWLVARAVFGRGHPAIDFLLLLAVADDAIGLGIIAVFYGDPTNPTRPEYLGLVAAAMAIAFTMRKLGVRTWVPYVVFAGPIAWLGLMLGHLHPALSLVVIVPFLPGPKRDTGLFAEEDEVDLADAAAGTGQQSEHSALHEFEHQLKLFVDMGLFFFAFTNAGVEFAGIGPMTWTILASLVVGKTFGVSLCSFLAVKLGFPLPSGMGRRDLLMAGFVAALGLTVALFVSAAAFTDAALLGQAKMGALFSGLVGVIAVVIGKAFGFGRRKNGGDASGDAVGEAEDRRRAVG